MSDYGVRCRRECYVRVHCFLYLLSPQGSFPDVRGRDWVEEGGTCDIEEKECFSTLE